jgi:hypothetical protein
MLQAAAKSSQLPQDREFRQKERTCVRETLRRTKWRREERRQIPSTIQKPREEEEEEGVRRHWQTHY